MTFSVKKIMKEDALVKTMITDLAGGFKEIIFPSKYLLEIIETGIAYDGSSFQGINNINASDAILKGNKETLVKVPEQISDTEKPEYWIICDIYDVNGKPHSNCARSKLKELQNILSKKWDGGNLYMGSEPESFFVQNRDEMKQNSGINSNYFNPKDPKSFIISEITNILGEMGFKIERAHTEVGEDQFEINWEYDRAERSADRIQIYKLVAHKVARNFGYDVTFLPKPYAERNGSGMHCHLSVANKNKNLFYDKTASKNKYFSKKSLQFLSGILKNSRSISAIANPTEVSFSRLVPGFEAPCIIAMGDRNRSAACRIPAIADSSKIKYAIRAEFRYPDPMANPYLLACGFIASGLDGIDRKIKFEGFCEEDLYALSFKEIIAKGYKMLPRNLWEAFNEFIESKPLNKYLGKDICQSFESLLLDEIESCQPYANIESMRKHYFR